MKKNVKVGEIHTVLIEGYNSKGQGVARISNLVAFVDFVIIGEEVEIEIIEVKKNYCVGAILNIVNKSKNRVSPKCQVFRECGGCVLQHMSYMSQLSFKKQVISDNLKKLADIDDSKIDDIVGMDEPIRYRNKIQYPISSNGEIKIGFFKRGTHEIKETDDCIIQPKYANKIKEIIKDFIRENMISIYSEKTRKGLLRGIVIRHSVSDDEYMLIIIINGNTIPYQDRLISIIKKDLEKIRSLYININKENKNYAFGEELIHLYGEKYITERIKDNKFRIYPKTFFQVNTKQTEKLYDLILKLSKPKKDDILYDLYCGAGTIGIYLAKNVKQVIGIEIVNEAVKAAKENAIINNLDNTKFYCGKAEKEIDKIKEKPNIIVVDPPRKGCDKKIIKTMIKLKPKKIVYVSCNPSTLARDIRLLNNKYRIIKITPVDLFPNTAHVECVLSMIRKDF